MPGACGEWFPESEHNAWHVEGVAHGERRAFVLIRPEPADVGYDLLVLLVVYSPDGNRIAGQAMYGQEEGGPFGLLGTTPACPTDIPSAVVW